MEFGCGSSWSILSDGISDFNSNSADVTTTEKVLTDGSNLIGKRIPEKDRTIQAVYNGKDPDSARAMMISFLNPKHSFKATVSYRGRKRWFEGELIEYDVAVGNAYSKPSVTFTILCLDPYFRDVDGNDRSLTDAEPMFGFPFVSIINERALAVQKPEEPDDEVYGGDWVNTGKVQSATIRTNKGTKVGKTVIYGASEEVTPTFPAGYTELEYIESTGTQYIDTGHYPSSKTRVVAEMDINSGTPTTCGVFGGRTSSTGGSFAMWIVSGKMRSDFGSTNQTSEVAGSWVVSIDKNMNSTEINGEELTSSAEDFVSTNTLTIFAVNGKVDGSAEVDERMVHAKLHRFEVYEDGGLVLDLVPCKRDDDGEIGMIDLVSERFFGNSGTGDFSAGYESSVPEGYTELEYIESNGTNWLDTGFLPSNNTRVELDIEPLVDTFVDTLYLMNTTDYPEKFFLIAAKSGPSFYFGWGDKSSSENAEFKGDFKSRHLIKINKNVCSIDNQKEISFNSVDFTISKTAPIFGSRTSDGATRTIKARCYRLKMWENDSIERHLVPCRNDDGEVGMYDLVNGNFRSVKGSGQFIGGPETGVLRIPMEEVGLSLSGNKWNIDLGGETLGDGQVLTIDRSGKASIDGVPIPTQTMPTMPEDDLTITTASSLPHFFEMEYREYVAPGPVPAPPIPVRGFLASRLIFDGKNTVYNNGDVPCFYTVRMEADGEIVNPMIVKDGKFVRVLDTMNAGDVIEIDFQSTPPQIRKNGENIIQMASRDSSFVGMQMKVGANVFTVKMDNEENRSLLKTSILHYERYLGV